MLRLRRRLQRQGRALRCEQRPNSRPPRLGVAFFQRQWRHIDPCSPMGVAGVTCSLPGVAGRCRRGTTTHLPSLTAAQCTLPLLARPGLHPTADPPFGTLSSNLCAGSLWRRKLMETSVQRPLMCAKNGTLAPDRVADGRDTKRLTVS
jgi:hypothetical protein